MSCSWSFDPVENLDSRLPHVPFDLVSFPTVHDTVLLRPPLFLFFFIFSLFKLKDQACATCHLSLVYFPHFSHLCFALTSRPVLFPIFNSLDLFCVQFLFNFELISRLGFVWFTLSLYFSSGFLFFCIKLLPFLSLPSWVHFSIFFFPLHLLFFSLGPQVDCQASLFFLSNSNLEKMKCFFFKDKSKGKQNSRSAPELQNMNKSSSPALNRAVKSSSSLPSPRGIPEMYKEKEHNLRVFSLQELREATNGFNRLLKIGEGGFGSVYKGKVQPVNGQGTPQVVAIKRLNKHGLQGHKEFLAEVQFLGVVNHPNVVKLLGYCCVDDQRGIQRLLVYEYMSNRSLEHHLFSTALPTLPWKTRLEIILGAAQGLAYLHGELEVQVIYRDFKASNVLLDEQFKPKLSDFGLAREGPKGDHTHVSTAVVGTYGYAAPEYIETGHLTIQTDIWGFGVVLYELLTGRRTVERNRPAAEQKLLDWIKQFPADSKKFSMIIDPRLRNEYPLAAARKVAKLADGCLNKNAKERPTMNQVVDCLKEAIQDSEPTTDRHQQSGSKPVTRKFK